MGDDETPADVGIVEVGAPAIQVAAGGGHTCALLDGGSVRCWGKNNFGQLGYGNTDPEVCSGTVCIHDECCIGDDPGETPAGAGDVPVGGKVIQLATGSSHTCALLENGAVRCWGDARNGRLGYENSNWIGDDETPADAGDVNLGGPAVQIGTGQLHTCALMESGEVRCWGSGTSGKLGIPGVDDNIGDDPGEMPPAPIDLRE